MEKINKYYISKSKDEVMELTFNENETLYIDFTWIVVSELITTMQINYNKRFLISHEEHDDDGLFGLRINFNALPTVKYKYKGKKNKMELLIYAIIRFSLN